MSNAATPRDYLAYLRDEANTTDWENGFITSCLSWLFKREGNKLSVKQNDILERMKTQYLKDVDDDEVAGWSDPREDDDVDDRVDTLDDLDEDDDIPF